MKRKKLCNVFIATSLLAILLTACSINNETAKEPELTLEDWVQPGWMIETLASREEYAVKFVDCWKSKGVTGARIDFGRPWIFNYSSGDLDVDKAQNNLDDIALSECAPLFPQPVNKFTKSSAESEYEKYQDIYTCFQVHNIDIGPAVSKERWIEEFNSEIVIKNGAVGVEFDPYQIILTPGSPYEISDSETLMNIQSECIGANWSSYGVSG